ncbi:hypothetical protein GN958_ATG16944 [Phytophthora infestans]|uniref:Uncharacterized protein n=1 Tax=Phytophthora infestans TaxID=4787 RepID=A0A8S9U2L4_PHYIN|nr:hypothetical protein GN958_ATG16944 [Phytophthora infestans]
MMFKLHVTTKLLQGASNYLADYIPNEFRKIYKPKLRSDSGGRSQIHRANGTSILGDNGAGSAPHGAATSGCHQATPSNNPYRVLCSQLNAGKATARQRITELIACGLSSALTDGVINLTPALQPQHEPVLQGIRRPSSPRCQRVAVSIEMLRQIITASNMFIAGHRVLCGAAVLGFFFCSRGAEYIY